jgi:hypothetical protein
MAKQKTKPKAKPAATKPRRVKPAQYKTFKLQKRIKHPVRLPSAYRLARLTLQTIKENKGLFAGITIIYGLANLILVQGITGGTDVSELKSAFNEVFTGNFGALSSSLSIFAILVGSAGNASSETAGAYQLFLALIVSLAIIWSLRQVLAGHQLKVKDAFYRGIYPLVPFVLVLMVVGLQLIPLLIGSSIFSLVTTTGIAVYFAEKFVWGLVYGGLALWTFYMLSSSLFALYIVTLPDMTPLKALRSARQLVQHRRWTVLRKVIALPFLLLLGAGLIMVPIIVWIAPLAEWTFFVLTMTSLLVVHAYMYTLYRELLNE